jgi:hypothetical protein
MGETAQEFIPSVMVDNRLTYHSAEPRHPVGQPLRDITAIERQIRASPFSEL